ncbi:hypothetical protein Tco_0320807 [Tanacetum coccineum]
MWKTVLRPIIRERRSRVRSLPPTRPEVLFYEPEGASLPLVGVGLSTSQPPPYTGEDGIGTHNPWKTTYVLKVFERIKWYQEPRSPCMVQTKSGYKASGESLTVLQQHRRPSHAKGATSTMTNTEDQPSGTGDLATKVDKLSKDLESVISWIRDQPPKAHVTPVKKRYAEYKFEDDDIEDGDDNNKKVHGPHYPFKVEARIDISTYDGTVDAEKLDSWISWRLTSHCTDLVAAISG